MGAKNFLRRVKRKLTRQSNGLQTVVENTEKEKSSNNELNEKGLTTLISALSNLDDKKSSLLVSNFIGTSKKQSEKSYIVHSGIESLHFNGASMEISGVAKIVGTFSMKDTSQKSLVLLDKSGKIAYEIPVKGIHIDNQEGELDTLIEDPLIINEHESSMELNGYQGSVNFNTINCGTPLKPGTYQLKVRLRNYINGKWIETLGSLGTFVNQTSDRIVSTTMYSFSARKNRKYSFTAKLSANNSSFEITSKLLSEVDPLEQVVDADLVMDSPEIRKIKNISFKFLYKYYSMRPIKSNKVSFVSDSRIDISGNFEYIYNKMLESETPFDISFFLKKSIKERKSFGEIRQLAKNLAQSRYIILDDFYPLIYPITIREGSDLIQVWHAVGAFKTFGYSRVGMPGGPKLTSINHRNYSKVVVSSESIVAKYAEGFGISKDKVFPIGAPRTDLFFDKPLQESIIANIRKELPFINGKKVILFAPTFRGNGQQSAYYPFEVIDFKKLYEALADQGWIFLMKIHPFVQNKPNVPYEYQDFIYDVSEYREINNLLLVTDVMITDYSSVCFEYGLLKRKMIFFSPDLAEYMSSRNFYYDYFDFIPGPYVSNTVELIQEIENPEIDTKRIQDFIEYYFDDLDGKASERFVDYLAHDFYEEPETSLAEATQDRTADGKIIPGWGQQSQSQSQSRKSNHSK